MAEAGQTASRYSKFWLVSRWYTTCKQMVKKSRGQPAKLRVTWKMATEIVCVCIGLAISRSRVRLLATALPGSDPGKVVHTRPQHFWSYNSMLTAIEIWFSPPPHFNGHFPGEPGLAGVYWSKGWWKWWWQLDYWSYKSCKAPVKSSPPTNQHPVFYRPDALPVAIEIWLI